MSLSEVERLFMLRRLKMLARPGEDSVKVPKAFLADLLEAAMEGVVDTDWYFETYPDVARAVSGGALGSAQEHFLVAGLYEGRLPYLVDIDEAAYLKKHRDVSDSVKNGVYQDAMDHFMKVGFGEGRAFQIATASQEVADDEPADIPDADDVSAA